MRIFSKKTFGFIDPNGGKLVDGIAAANIVRTTPGEFQDVPDWVAKDDMFKWAQADGDIEVTAVAPQVTVEAKASK